MKLYYWRKIYHYNNAIQFHALKGVWQRHVTPRVSFSTQENELVLVK